jgi:hypothetical protein
MSGVVLELQFDLTHDLLLADQLRDISVVEV